MHVRVPPPFTHPQHSPALWRVTLPFRRCAFHTPSYAVLQYKYNKDTA